MAMDSEASLASAVVANSAITSAAASSETSASSATKVRTKSCRQGASNMPRAEKLPGYWGITTVGIEISRAMDKACSGPAPPKAIIAHSLGSEPLATDTARTDNDMALSVMRAIPRAASATLRPNGSAIFSATARSAKARSRPIRPDKKRAPLSRPSTRSASVTTGSAPPLP